jgi:hypothetical protein
MSNITRKELRTINSRASEIGAAVRYQGLSSRAASCAWQVATGNVRPTGQEEQPCKK